ncbi:MAG: hypothetical protein ACREOO_15190 [bacterium]
MANSEARPVFRFFMSNRISLSALGAVRNISQAQVDTLTSSDQPRSALFQRESTASQLTMGFGWFLFGLHILIALLFSGLSGYTAISKGLNPIPYFFIGFFLSAFGFLYVLTRPSVAKPGDVPAGLVKVHTTLEPVPCPKCGNTNHPAAKKCLNCGSELQPLAQSDVVRAK